jgi:hypothetical protein
VIAIAAVPLRGVTDQKITGRAVEGRARPAPTRPCAIASRQIVEARATTRGSRATSIHARMAPRTSRVMQNSTTTISTLESSSYMLHISLQSA